MSEITIADLRAVGDVADALAEQSDGLSAEQSVQLLTAAREAKAKLQAAIDMLEAQALTTIEQPILVGKTAWTKKPEFKRRPNWVLIRSTVIDQASAPSQETGEFPHPRDAAEAAVSMMAALYVSPSTSPKTGGVKALGLSLEDATVEEHTGFALKAVELE